MDKIEIPSLTKLISTANKPKPKEKEKPRPKPRPKPKKKNEEEERIAKHKKECVKKDIEQYGTANPFGKEKAKLEGRLKSKVKISLDASSVIAYLQEDFGDNKRGLFANIDRVKDNAKKATLKMDLIKLVLPKPKSQEEIDNERKIASSLHNAYFGDNKVDVEDE